MTYNPVLTQSLQIGNQFIEDRNTVTRQIIWEVNQIDEDQIQVQSTTTGIIQYFPKDKLVFKIDL